jgi:hypothetical protein
MKKFKLAKECIGIVNQLYDLAEVPTEKRQAINDKADKYLLDQVLRLSTVSQQRELLNSFMDYLQESENDGETVVDRQAFINGFLETI